MTFKVGVNGETVASYDKKLKRGWYVFQLKYNDENYKIIITPRWKYKIKQFFSSIFRRQEKVK